MLKRIGTHPIFNNIANSPSLVTRSKALVRSMKAIYKGTFCSLHFSCSCRTQQIMSVVKRSDLNPHCDSFGQLLYAMKDHTCKCFASRTKQRNSPLVIAIRSGTVVLIEQGSANCGQDQVRQAKSSGPRRFLI